MPKKEHRPVERAPNPLKVNPSAMMTTEIFEWISGCINPEAGPILEFGSGYGTHILLDMGYVVVSVEEEKAWANKYHNNYVYSPLDVETGWYEASSLKEGFKQYKDIADVYGWQLTIIDGPTVNRGGILPYLDYLGIGLNSVVIDDIDRGQNKLLLKTVQHHCQQTRKRIWDDEEFFSDEMREMVAAKYTINGVEDFLEAPIWTVPCGTAAIVT